jgi:phospholipid-binding lipoprotein MlaA
MMNKFIITIYLLYSTVSNAQSLSYNYSEMYDSDVSIDSNIDSDFDSQKNSLNNDPLEPLNRFIFGFNMVLDNVILEPVSKIYTNIVPYYGRARITDFFSNLNTPTTVANNILQLEGKEALTSFWRFVINSTFGVFGLFDVASEVNLHKKTNNLGKTLIKWGFKPGPYLVLPILGPSTLTAAVGTFGDSYIDYKYFTSHKLRDFKRDIRILKLINFRANSAPIINNIKYNSLDPYIAARSMYLQNKAYLQDNTITNKGF